MSVSALWFDKKKWNIVQIKSWLESEYKSLDSKINDKEIEDKFNIFYYIAVMNEREKIEALENERPFEVVKIADIDGFYLSMFN